VGHGMLTPVLLLAAIAVLPFAGCRRNAGAVPIYGYEVVASFPHDPAAYCQGLLFADGAMYESTGRYGQSTLRKVRLETGEVVQTVRLPDELFGEGLALWGDRLIQLTWKNRVGRVYEKEGLRLTAEFPYPTEGWGLTSDGRSLISSDGSSTLRFLDPSSFAELRRIQVRSVSTPISELNELEYVRGEIYANIWGTWLIARIDPSSGAVLGWIDLMGIATFPPVADGDAVLNGIAYDAEKSRLFVTGKLWPRVYEIEVLRKG
jgi:glutaminyl-peptide cyclotransferase